MDKWLYCFIPSLFLVNAQDQKIHLVNFCYNASLEGFRLNTTIFTSTNVSGWMDCLIECNSEPCCRSINFKKISSFANEPNCEMLHNVVYNTSERLLINNASYNYVYFFRPEKEYNASCLIPKDIDECSQTRSVCHENAKCTNTMGSYECECHVGYYGDGNTCEDVDECSDGNHHCNSNAICSNTEGSYTCQCRDDYGGDGKRCRLHVLNSKILSSEPSHFARKLEEWLPKTGNWNVCWEATRHGWESDTFHSKCDSKEPTLAIIKVVRNNSNLIFGGYAAKSWQIDVPKSAPGSFLFSLRNNHDLLPFKSPLNGNGCAIYSHSNYGPTFGAGRDIYVANNAGSNSDSFTNYGYSYDPPSGYTYTLSETKSLLAGSYHFTPSEVEVLYLN